MNLTFILESNLKNKKGLFIPYIAVGYPTYEVSYEIIKKLIELKADSIELGLPFTDPVADGEVLQNTFEYILNHKFSMDIFIQFLKKLHINFPNFPFLVMGYTNLFLKFCSKSFFSTLYKNGVRGLIIPDLPFEERKILFPENILSSIHFISFITLNTNQDRIHKILKEAEGFIYLVSVKGITGSRDINFTLIEKIIKKLRTQLPILVGFGIKSSDDIKNSYHIANGFILGSMIHKIIKNNLNKEEKIPLEVYNAVRKILK